MRFHDYTLTAAGEIASRRRHYSERLVRDAVAVFAGMLCGGGGDFRAAIPLEFVARIELQWTCPLPGVAVATFWVGGRPLTTSVLLGRNNDPADEAHALRSVQGIVNALLRDTGLEPAFELREIADRPVIATLVLPGPPHPDLPLVADMETCLGAAAFEGWEN